MFSTSNKCILHINAHKNPSSNQIENMNLGKYFEKFSAEKSCQTLDLSGNVVFNLLENSTDNTLLMALNSSQLKNTNEIIEKLAEISDISTNYDRMIIENPDMFQIQPTLVDNTLNIDMIEKTKIVEAEKANNLGNEGGMRFIRLNELTFDHKHTNISIEHQDRDSHFMDFQQPLEQMSELLKSSENVEFLPDTTAVASEEERESNEKETSKSSESMEATKSEDEGKDSQTLESVLKDTDCKESKTSNSTEKPKKSGVKHKKHSCNECPKAFTKPIDLKRHLMTHSKTKPFKCSHPNCSSSFTLKATLKRHTWTHADPSEKPSFSCYICNKSLSSSTNLNLHLQLHSEDASRKRFSCPYDSLKFRTSGNLKAHLRVHNKLAKEQGKDPNG
jgi:hypothetical protein